MRAATQLGIKGAGQGVKIPQFGTLAFLWEATMSTRGGGVLLRESADDPILATLQHG